MLVERHRRNVLLYNVAALLLRSRCLREWFMTKREALDVPAEARPFVHCIEASYNGRVVYLKKVDDRATWFLIIVASGMRTISTPILR